MHSTNVACGTCFQKALLSFLAWRGSRRSEWIDTIQKFACAEFFITIRKSVDIELPITLFVGVGNSISPKHSGLFANICQQSDIIDADQYVKLVKYCHTWCGQGLIEMMSA